jgi:hypothetical protein
MQPASFSHPSIHQGTLGRQSIILLLLKAKVIADVIALLLKDAIPRYFQAYQVDTKLALFSLSSSSGVLATTQSSDAIPLF